MSNTIDKQKLVEWLDVSIEGVPCKHISLDLLREKIQSGAFDIPNNQLKVFTCPQCYDTRDQHVWNEATRTIYGNDIGEIQTAEGDNFICPTCNVKSGRSEIEHISALNTSVTEPIQTLCFNCPKCSKVNAMNVRGKLENRPVGWFMCSFCRKPSDKAEWLAVSPDVSEPTIADGILQAIKDFVPNQTERAGYNALIAWIESTVPSVEIVEDTEPSVVQSYHELVHLISLEAHCEKDHSKAVSRIKRLIDEHTGLALVTEPSVDRAREAKLVFIGDKYYMASGTMMSSLYEEGTGKRYDWGFVQRDLRNGVPVAIRPATNEEIESADAKLAEIQNMENIARHVAEGNDE